MARISSIYFGDQEMPEGYEAAHLIGKTGKAPNAYIIRPPLGDSSWAAGLTLATSNSGNFNPFYWSRVFAGEQEPEKKRERERYFNRPGEFIKERVYDRGHRIPAELIGAEMVYIEGTKALFFDIWRTINTHSKVFSGGLELSLRRTPGTGKSVLGGAYGKYFREADEFMKHNVEVLSGEHRDFNAYEDFRRLLPCGYLTYGSLLFNNRYMGKVANHLQGSPVYEFQTLGRAMSSHVEKNSGFELDEIPEVNPISFGKLSGTLPLEPKKENLTYRTRASLVISHQLIRNRLNSLDNFLVTEHVMPSPSICDSEQAYCEFNELLERSRESMQKYRDREETAIYSALVGQVIEADIRFPDTASLQDFLDVRDCNQAQGEAQSIGWALRSETRSQGIETGIRCRLEPTCPEFSHIKDRKKRYDDWRECMGKKYGQGERLFRFHKKQLESFLS